MEGKIRIGVVGGNFGQRHIWDFSSFPMLRWLGYAREAKKPASRRRGPWEFPECSPD